MGIITWMVIVGGMVVMIWYGFNLLVRKPGAGTGPDSVPVASCHLCRRSFPVDQMVSRDKIAGFINYFCGDCIEGLYSDYTAMGRDGGTGSGSSIEQISRN
jgi:hypothetical protein